MTTTAPGLRPMPRLARFFFMHLGTLVSVIVYFQVFQRNGLTLDALRTALWTGLIVKSGYMALAWNMGEHKYFDVGIWLLFAVGALASLLDVRPVLELYHVYSPALLFATLAACAGVPLLLGRKPFTMYYARRTIPHWQVDLPETERVSRIMAAYWMLVFIGAAALCAHAPADPRFNLLYPNLLVFIVGIPAQFWLPPLYFRFFPPSLPRAIEPLLMGMSMVFDRRAAGDARARIQFHVSGPGAGKWWLQVADGKCETFAGEVRDADLVVSTPDSVWVRIAHGELDGAEALTQGLYQASGDYTILTRMNAWFAPAR